MIATDPSAHLGLIHRVIRQMNVPLWLRDECESEGLLAIAVAAQKYDPSRQVPLANWLAKNVRWTIANWLTAQRETVPIEWTESPAPKPSGMRPAGIALEGSTEAIEASIELKQVLILMDRILTQRERQVLLAGAIGYSGVEIAKALRITTVAVSRARTAALGKLREYH